jgi:hypothetical protein
MSRPSEYSLHELILSACGSKPAEIQLGLIFAKTNDQRVELVEEALTWIVI